MPEWRSPVWSVEGTCPIIALLPGEVEVGKNLRVAVAGDQLAQSPDRRVQGITAPSHKSSHRLDATAVYLMQVFRGERWRVERYFSIIVNASRGGESKLRQAFPWHRRAVSRAAPSAGRERGVDNPG